MSTCQSFILIRSLENQVYKTTWYMVSKRKKMGSKITKLDTTLIIFLRGNKTTTFSVIFSINRKSFLSLQEKSHLHHYWIKAICILMVFNKLIANFRDLQNTESRVNSKSKLYPFRRSNATEARILFCILFCFISDFWKLFFLKREVTWRGESMMILTVPSSYFRAGEHCQIFLLAWSSKGYRWLVRTKKEAWIINALPLGMDMERRAQSLWEGWSGALGLD